MLTWICIIQGISKSITFLETIDSISFQDQFSEYHINIQIITRIKLSERELNVRTLEMIAL